VNDPLLGLLAGSTTTVNLNYRDFPLEAVLHSGRDAFFGLVAVGGPKNPRYQAGFRGANDLAADGWASCRSAALISVGHRHTFLSSTLCTEPSASFVDARERHRKPLAVCRFQSVVEIVLRF
jgi:hypothetical protein